MENDASATFATADGIAVGTVDYMSPEQACGREVDGRSDVYGLGCAMYHLMTGKLPFPGTSPIERLGKRISGRHIPITEHLPDLPTHVVRVLDKMMAHKPHERFASAGELADALRALVRSRSRSGDSKPAPGHALAASVAGRRPGLAGDGGRGTAGIGRRADDRRDPAELSGWFAPIARFAESRPGMALAAAILAAWLTFGVGFLLGFVVK